MEVTFEDGSHAKGKLVLGADGYFSKVREHCLGDGPPDFAVSLSGSWMSHRVMLDSSLSSS